MKINRSAIAALAALSMLLVLAACEEKEANSTVNTNNGGDKTLISMDGDNNDSGDGDNPGDKEYSGGDGHFNPDINYGSFTDSRDGQVYRTVTIGTQTWMARNLNYAGSGDVGSCHDNEPDSCAKYGRRYDWAAAMGFAPGCNADSCVSRILDRHQGICPDGWHIPKEAEVAVLRRYVGPPAGVKLKAASGWNMGNGDMPGTGGAGSNAPPAPPPIPGTDEFGFSALPTTPNKVYSGAAWWSATEHEPAPAGCRHCWSVNNTFIWSISNNNYGLGWSIDYKSHPNSVRCLLD